MTPAARSGNCGSWCHRAKLVALRSHSEAEVHAVLAKCTYAARIGSLLAPTESDEPAVGVLADADQCRIRAQCRRSTG